MEFARLSHHLESASYNHISAIFVFHYQVCQHHQQVICIDNAFYLPERYHFQQQVVQHQSTCTIHESRTFHRACLAHMFIIEAMVRKIKQLPSLHTAAATRLLMAVQSSAFTEEAKVLLATAVDQSVLQDSPSNASAISPPSKRSRSFSWHVVSIACRSFNAMQLMSFSLFHLPPRTGGGYQYLHQCITSYLTEQDMVNLRDERRPLANKLQVIVDRLIRLGVNSPDEVTIAWCVGVVVVCHFTSFPLYSSIFACVHDIKGTFKASQKPWPFEWIQRCPFFP